LFDGTYISQVGDGQDNEMQYEPQLQLCAARKIAMHLQGIRIERTAP